MESATERHNQQPRDRISNPRDRIIGHNKLLGVEPGGGPENQDDKMVRGVHLVENLILLLKVLDVECQT